MHFPTFRKATEKRSPERRQRLLTGILRSAILSTDQSGEGSSEFISEGFFFADFASP
jgi:hypothetical protein